MRLSPALPGAEVLESSRFDDFEEFAAAVQRLWDAQWEAVFAAPRHGMCGRRQAGGGLVQARGRGAAAPGAACCCLLSVLPFWMLSLLCQLLALTDACPSADLALLVQACL